MIRSLAVLAAAYRGSIRPCVRTRIAGVDSMVARPKRGDGPVVLYANAATPRGVDEPAVGRFLGGLARAGFVAVAPELPCVRYGEVTPATVDALVAVADAAGRRVALIGASTGAGLVILAASDPRLAPRVTAVTSVVPFASLRNILELGTTGFYDGRPFAAAPLVASAAGRSLAASAPDDPGVPALLGNRDPRCFDELYEELAPATRSLVEELSPVRRVRDVLAPVEIVSAPDDAFFPVAESHTLAEAGRDVRLTVTPALTHVCPRLRPGLVRVAAVLDRTLARAANAERPATVLEPSPAW